MKYAKLANDLEHLITSRVLGPGQRLPSIRTLSRSHSVSISTVVHAFHELERRHLVEARPRSGYFVMPAEANNTHAPQWLDRFDDIMPEMLAESSTGELTRLGIAQLEPDLVPDADLKRITRGILRGSGRALLEYPPPAGVRALRRRVCELMFQYEAALQPDEVLITSGCQEALWIALQCVAGRGDTIAVASPTYPGLLKILQCLEVVTDRPKCRDTEKPRILTLGRGLHFQPMVSPTPLRGRTSAFSLPPTYGDCLTRSDCSQTLPSTGRFWPGFLSGRVVWLRMHAARCPPAGRPARCRGIRPGPLAP